VPGVSRVTRAACSVEPCRPGVGGSLTEAGGRGEVDGRRRPIDWKVPAVTGNVPVKFVIVFEAADHPRRMVADGVVVLALGNDAVGTPDADSNAVALCLDPGRLGLAIERGADQVEPDLDPPSAGRVVAGREIAENAVIDRDILDPHMDRLGNVKRSVWLDRNLAVEAQDPLFRGRVLRQEEQGE
jgi:hypothetical protein